MFKEIWLQKKQIQPIIVGFGHCGRNLHYAAINKIRQSLPNINISENIAAIDLDISNVDKHEYQHIEAHDGLLPAAMFDKNDIMPIVHICSPPDTHLEVMRDALKKGYKHLIIEKPMASSIVDAKKMVELGENSGVQVRLVANWIHSALVEELMKLIDTGQYGKVIQLEVAQHKPRFTMSKSRKDEHIFDIEMPHQVALAQYVGGEPLSLLSSHVEDMVYDTGRITNMGAGNVVLSHNSGTVSLLCTKLNHHSRERSIKVTFESGHQFVGYFPVSRDDSYSQYQISSTLESSAKKIIFDEPLTRCIESFYLSFLGKETFMNKLIAASSLKFHLNTIETIEQAKGLDNQSSYLKHQAV